MVRLGVIRHFHVISTSLAHTTNVLLQRRSNMCFVCLVRVVFGVDILVTTSQSGLLEASRALQHTVTESVLGAEQCKHRVMQIASLPQAMPKTMVQPTYEIEGDGRHVFNQARTCPMVTHDAALTSSRAYPPGLPNPAAAALLAPPAGPQPHGLPNPAAAVTLAPPAGP